MLGRTRKRGVEDLNDIMSLESFVGDRLCDSKIKKRKMVSKYSLLALKKAFYSLVLLSFQLKSPFPEVLGEDLTNRKYQKAVSTNTISESPSLFLKPSEILSMEKKISTMKVSVKEQATSTGKTGFCTCQCVCK